MKLRRAMAVAAATAVIAPLALLSAPAAFAEETPTTQSSPTSGESTPSQESSPSSEAGSPTDAESTPAGQSPSTPAGETPSTPAEEETPSADETTPGTETTSPAASPSPSASESAPAEDDDVELCVDEDGNDTAELSADLRSGLSGLPETIVAGSGWTAFSFNVSNRGDDEIKDIKPLIGVAALGWDEDDPQDYSGHITVQVFNTATGKWDTLAGAAGEGGTFAAFSLGAGQSVSYKLRLSIDGKVPDSLGITGGFAEYADDEGCWVADDSDGWIYFFDILAAGSDGGKPNDAKPQTGGMADLDQVSDVKVTGSLAETGSSSALPMIGLIGGAAVVAGAGAVFVVRRRKAGTEA
ncbi:LAETG motif-containing sortase-dependent surface protein [Streptomyces fungicidicus]|uniref:LAETG motif-containing sortase-dependent surface protein n=1 Tax=Streptomyces TaxID=1883 RepID=UPI0011508457|nr:LAETG motif-containing sortase-dependent surface protein [Streptomyces sp. SLBN-134]TQL20692.1 LPXTG-motif cell wall-anchored protein [Streptomyces sp. SLBN-134]